nr:unnamed protein product [Spirometra erinaceieuropaei]
MVEPVQRHSVHTLVFRSLKRTHDMFEADQARLPELDEKSEKLKMNVKKRDQYGPILHQPIATPTQNTTLSLPSADSDNCNVVLLLILLLLLHPLYLLHHLLLFLQDMCPSEIRVPC